LPEIYGIFENSIKIASFPADACHFYKEQAVFRGCFAAESVASMEAETQKTPVNSSPAFENCCRAWRASFRKLRST